MNIKTRLRIMTIASGILVVAMTFLFYWSNHRVTEAIKALNLANEIVGGVFERNILRDDYLRSDNQRAKDQWLSKQNQIGALLSKASLYFNSTDDRKTINNLFSSINGSSAVFQQIIENRMMAGSGRRNHAQANEVENRLVGQLFLKSYDTVADAQMLQQVGNRLIKSTQRTAATLSLAFIMVVAAFVAIVTRSLGQIISKGITKLQEGSAAIGSGALDYTIPLDGSDELAEVAGAFNLMAEKLRASHAALEQEVAERKRAADEVGKLNQELGLAVSQLKGANQELEAFAYSVSHDLRAPLRAMSGFSQALVEDFGDALEGEARSYLDEIVIGSRHMGQLIDGLLTLSRSTRGELRRDLVDLSALAEAIRLELEQAEPTRRAKWQIASGLRAWGDSRMIEVVMRNLLENAWKYSASKSETEIRVYEEQNADGHFFCITDNGAGFDMAYADKLFQPFQRLHRQDEFPGIGIGLATAQRIIHRHGGTIQAVSAPNGGALFRFSLPLAEKQLMEEP